MLPFRIQNSVSRFQTVRHCVQLIIIGYGQSPSLLDAGVWILDATFTAIAVTID